MSHSSEVINYKKSLIEKGITNPVVQSNLALNAYAFGFIRFFTQSCIDADDREDIMMAVLSHWNEKEPVNGNRVIVLVKNFYMSLTEGLSTIKGSHFVEYYNEDPNTKEHPDYNEPESFIALVEQLATEAAHIYKATHPKNTSL